MVKRKEKERAESDIPRPKEDAGSPGRIRAPTINFQDNKTVNVGAQSASCADTGQPIHAWWRGLTAPVSVDQLDCSVRRTIPGGHSATDTPEARSLAKKRLGGGQRV